jgi:hypothetical protein
VRWLLPLAAIAVALVALSGAQNDDPRTPPAVAGNPPPFLGTAVIGEGGVTAAVDAYGGLVDLRASGPAGPAQIRNSAGRQRVGSVPADTGVTVAAASAGHDPAPLWRGGRLRQRYLPASNVLVTRGSVDGARVTIRDAATGVGFVRRIAVHGPDRLSLRLGVNLDLEGSREDDRLQTKAGGFMQDDGETTVRCGLSRGAAVVTERGDDAKLAAEWRGAGPLVAKLACAFHGPPPTVDRTLAAAVVADRRWLARARPLGPKAPSAARRMYSRSLLVLRALTDRRTGASVAGPRDLWALVWPRDAGTAALALRAAGYSTLADRVAGFLGRLDSGAGARFRGDGSPLRDGRGPAGDARGWISVAGGGAGTRKPREHPWTDRQDYAEREDDTGDYLANAIASGVPAAEILRRFETPRGLVRTSGDPASGLDSAAAWGVRPFDQRRLRQAARRTLLTMVDRAGRFGIRPSESLPGTWMAPTAWSAWSLAALGDRAESDRLLRKLERAAAPAGTLPERVDDRTGVPVSTTPLGWPHAFAVLALRERYG